MSPADRARTLAEELERAIPLCTSRIEHIRVTGLAIQARELADTLAGD